MTRKKAILGVFAHPDDESMGPGGAFAKYAAAGHRVAFVTATDGGAGRLYDTRPEDNSKLRNLRRAETARSVAPPPERPAQAKRRCRDGPDREGRRRNR